MSVVAGNQKNILVPRFFTWVALFVFFTFAYIVSPYWTVLPSFNLKIAYLVIFFLVGMVWTSLSSSSLKIEINFSHIINFVLVLIVVAILNYRTFPSVIPWRGDEDFHILLTNYVVTRTPNSWFVYGSVITSLILFLAWKKSYWVFPVGALFILLILFSLNSKNPYQNSTEIYLRYPFINYWFYAFIPKLVSLFDSFYHEFLFRLPILICVAILISGMLSKIKSSFSFSFSVLWTMAFATIPILFYYTSILYLELPIILLMFIIISDARILLQSDYETLKQMPSWYSLLIIGFIKETTIPFLLCFLIARWIALIISRKNKTNYVNVSKFKTLLQEFLIATCILLPGFLYLYLRTFVATEIRPYKPLFHNLLDLQIYSIEARALVSQVGIILIIFLASIIFSFYQKKYLNTFFCLSIIFMYFIFFAMDNKIYTGYSRFNLFLLPSILVCLIYFLKKIIEQRYRLSMVTACIILVGNLLITPINLDGTKKPYWNNYLANLSEKYYPYEDALQWIKENHPYDKILLTGLPYPYASLSFYFEKLEWHPRIVIKLTPEEEFSTFELLVEASENGFEVVVIPVIYSEDFNLQKTEYYQLEMVSTNQAHTLLIYSRISSP